MKKYLKTVGLGFLSLVLIACSNTNTKPDETKLDLGSTVVEDKDSPTGYTVTFTYQSDYDEEISTVSVVGPFNYLDPDLDINDKENAYGPNDYKDGYYASSYVPSKGMETGFNYSAEMTYDDSSDTYSVSFPISSGSFLYSYVIDFANGESETIADPENPAPSLANKKSNVETSDASKSLVYGSYDAKKQSKSPNLDFVKPKEKGDKGSLSYVEYEGNLSDNQDLGIYLPINFDKDREEGYKVIYISHGGGGNETDWFASGHIDNIMDNLEKDYIVVTMDNTSYEWDFEKIENNVLNYIIPYMEKNYNASADAADRAFAGLSMGSMTTMNMLFDYPESFAYFGSFSGTDMMAVNDNEAVKTPTFYMTIGLTDIASEKVLPNDDEAKKKKYEDFIAWEKENDLPNFIDGGYLKGGHDWFVWSQSFKTFVEEICWPEELKD